MKVLLPLIGLPLVLVLPGLVTLWALAPLRRLGLLERIYLLLSISLLLSGWLGLLLAQVGSYSPGLLLGLLFLYLVGMGGWAWRRGRPLWPAPERPLSLPFSLGVLLVTAVLAGLTFRPFELILGPRDAAVYPATAAAIARHGSVRIEDPLVAELAREAVENQERFFAQFFPPQHEGRFYYTHARMPGLFIADMAKGTVIPQFYHLYPTWLAIAFGLVGRKAGLLMTPYLSLLGGVGVLLLGRRLFGDWVGLGAGLFLSLNALQVWFARYSVSEGATQFLLFLALYAFARLEGGQEKETGFFGLLAGVAVGLVGLVRVDFVFVWLLLLPYLAHLFVRKRLHRGQRLFLLGWGLLAVHTFAQMLTLTWNYTLNSYYHRIQDWYTLAWLVYPLLTPILQEYFRGRTPVLHQPWRLVYELGVPLLVLAGLVALRRSEWLRRRVKGWWERRRQVVLWAVAGLFLLAAAYAYLVRPAVLTSEVLLHPWENRLVLEGYIGAPLPEGQAANLVRLGWYLSPLGVALGVLGIAGLILSASRRSWLLLLLGLVHTGLFTYQVFGMPHHIYIMRRYVPVVLPFFCLGMAWLLVRLARWERPRRVGLVVAAGLALLMVLYLAYTGRPFFRHTEYRGALEQVGALAERFQPEDVLLLIGGHRDAPFTIATPLEYLYERNALVLIAEKPDAALIEGQIRRWQEGGRNVYLLIGSSGGRLYLPHTRLEPLARFELAVPEFEQLTAQKPHNAYILRQQFGIYRPVVAAGDLLGPLPTTIDLGAEGYRNQAAGFYLDEVAPDGTTYCWTDGNALLRLPWPREAVTVTVTLRMAGGKRPAELGPAQVRLCFGEDCPATWTLQESFGFYSLTLPPGYLSPDEGGTVLLALRSAPWRQVDYGLGGDARTLGVQVDRVEVLVTPGPIPRP